MTSSRPDGPVEGYVQQVLKMIPRQLPERVRIELEVRSHLIEQLDAGVPPEEAVRRMGSAEEVARGYLAELELTEASVARRTGAFLIDLGVGALVLTPIWIGIFFLLKNFTDAYAMASDALWGGLFFLPFLVLGAIPVLAIFYFPVMEALFGETAGKRAVGIYVVGESGEAIGWGPAILRRLPFVLEIFWIDAFFAFFTRRRQRAFDLVARTVVVRK